MSPSGAPHLPKWPFLLGDLLLIGFAVYLVGWGATPISFGQAVVSVAAVFCGAWLCVMPFLKDHRAAIRLAEADRLAATVTQLGDLARIKSEITQATADWQTAHQQSGQAVSAARELSDRIKTQVADCCEFLKQAQDTDKAHLRLEVEKLRRTEGEWLQAMVHVFDHVFALHKAASRSGQPTVVAQLDRFQFACRDVARRLGLVPFIPSPADVFDAGAHQLAEPEVKVGANASIADVLAAGYTFQGKLLRRALVRVSEQSTAELVCLAAEPAPPQVPQG